MADGTARRDEGSIMEPQCPPGRRKYNGNIMHKRETKVQRDKNEEERKQGISELRRSQALCINLLVMAIFSMKLQSPFKHSLNQAWG